MTDKKVSFLEQFYNAMFKPGFYKQFSKFKASSSVIYVVVFMIFMGLVRLGMPAAAWVAGQGGLNNLIGNKLPEFTIANGHFNISKDFETNIADTIYVVADRSIKSYTYDDLNKEQQATYTIALGRDSIYIMPGAAEYARTFDWSFIVGDSKVTNDTLLENIGYIYMEFVLYLIIGIIMMVLGYLISTAVYALIGRSFSKMLKLELTYGQVYKLALYAGTLGYVINSVVMLLSKNLSIYMIAITISMLATIFILNAGIAAHKLPETPSGLV